MSLHFYGYRNVLNCSFSFHIYYPYLFPYEDVRNIFVKSKPDFFVVINHHTQLLMAFHGSETPSGVRLSRGTAISCFSHFYSC